MMFTASKAAFTSALSLSGGIVERRNTMPILQNVLFQQSAAGLTAVMTDLDLEAAVDFAASVDPGFTPFTVPAHLLNDIVRKLPDGAEIKVKAGNDQQSSIIISSGKSRFTMQVLPAKDFPRLTTGDFDGRLTLEAPALAAAIFGVRFAISTEETRYYLNGIFLHPSPSDETGAVTLVATDGHRLAKRILKLATVPTFPGVIMPKKTIETFAKVLPKDGEVTLDVSAEKIRLTSGGTVLTSKLIDGTFPDYQRVIPSDQPVQVEVEGKLLATALDRVAAISTQSGKAATFAFGDGTLRLSMNNPDAGQSEDEVQIDGAADLTTGFNARYVLEALGQLGDGPITIHLSDASSPAVLRADGDHKDNLVVLMPMRV